MIDLVTTVLLEITHTHSPIAPCHTQPPHHVFNLTKCYDHQSQCSLFEPSPKLAVAVRSVMSTGSIPPGPDENRGPDLFSVLIIFPIIATITVVLRLITRTWVVKNIGIEDACMVFALVSCSRHIPTIEERFSSITLRYSHGSPPHSLRSRQFMEWAAISGISRRLRWYKASNIFGWARLLACWHSFS